MSTHRTGPRTTSRGNPPRRDTSRGIIVLVPAILLTMLLAGCADRSPAEPAASGAPPAKASSSAKASPAASTPKVRSWGSPDLTSGLQIPARQRFIFAGGQDRGFEARAFNRGTVPVTIRGDLEGVLRDVATIAPGETAVATFAPREAALFDNPSEVEAAAKVEIWGEASVGMRYIDLR